MTSESLANKGMRPMASLNRVVILGNLGQDPELRYTQSQTPVCTLSVATTEYRPGPDGQRQELTEWHRIVVWGRMAENASKYLTKGRSVLVEGRIQTRNWEDKSGQKRYVTEIVATNLQFVGGQGGQRERPAGAGMSSGEGGGPRGGFGGGGGRAPYNGPGTGQDAGPSEDYGSFGGPETPNLDEIPF